MLRGTKSSKGPWLQVSSSPQSSWRVACGPLGELRGCQGLSPLRQWHLVLTQFILTPPSPAPGRGPVGSTNSVKLKLALLLGAPISVHTAIFPALRPQPDSSHPVHQQTLAVHLQDISRTCPCSLIPGHCYLSFGESHRLFIVSLLPVPHTQPEGPDIRARSPYSEPSHGYISLGKGPLSTRSHTSASVFLFNSPLLCHALATPNLPCRSNFANLDVCTCPSPPWPLLP